MKQILTLLLITFSCYSQEKIAVITDNGYEFAIDTLSYKQNLEKQLSTFVSGKTITFNRIEVVKQKALLTKIDFYYLLLTDAKNNSKVAKWLNKEGNNLISNDEITEGDLFEQTFLLCAGTGDCSPQVMEDEEGRFWMCSTEIMCPVEEDPNPPCIAYKMLLGMDE